MPGCLMQLMPTLQRPACQGAPAYCCWWGPHPSFFRAVRSVPKTLLPITLRGGHYRAMPLAGEFYFLSEPTCLLDNYRGIAVGSAVGKVFSLVLHARLNGWAEDQGLRATGQAGFREGKCTNNHIFVLKHLIDRCQGSDRVYACFIDFRKAYDLVRRDLLLQCLADMGLHGSMLSCLVSMYWSTPMLVKNGSEVGGQVDSNIGVKQGDPLSPLLFGLFIDRVEAWLRDKASQCGVELGGALLRVLLYADDLTLLARSPADLQTLLDALSEFCSANCLYVNVAKSAVMVFGRQKPRVGVHIPPAGWVFEGAQLPVVSEFRYLGITFHETSGVSACTSALAAAAMRAMWGVLARCKSMEMPTLALRMSLFEYIVAPILTYGSEVWGPTVLAPCSTVQKCLGLSLLRPLFVFLRRLGGNLRRGTSSQLLLREFGAKPLARAWLRACIQLWNRGVQLPSSDPMARALAENVSMTHRPARVWSVGLETVLRRIHALPAGGLVAGGEGTPLARLDEAEILRCFDEWFVSGYHDLPADPRSAPSTSVTLCTYERWFSVDPIADNYVEGRWSGVPQYVCQTAGIPAHHVRSLAAFRLGAHHYDVATGRWARQPRHQRICSVCHTGVGDEWHVVFECEGQQVPRQQHAPLFQAFGGWASPAPDSLPSDSLREFMAQCPRRVAAFLYACEQRASQLPPDEVLFGDHHFYCSRLAHSPCPPTKLYTHLPHILTHHSARLLCLLRIVFPRFPSLRSNKPFFFLPLGTPTVRWEPLEVSFAPGFFVQVPPHSHYTHELQLP